MKQPTKYEIVGAVLRAHGDLINPNTLEIQYTKALAHIRKKGIMTTNREDSFKREMRRWRQCNYYEQLAGLHRGE